MPTTFRPLRQSGMWLAVAAVTFLAGCDPMKRHVTYIVTSKANAVDITSVDAYGDSNDQVVKPPWTITFLGVPHSLLSISAQAMGPRGGVACAVIVDGKTLQSADAKGVDAVADCKAEAP